MSAPAPALTPWQSLRHMVARDATLYSAGAAACRGSEARQEAAHWGRAMQAVLRYMDALSAPRMDGRAVPAEYVSAEHREVLGQALADAIEYRTPEASCTGCDDHPAGLCDDHAADLDLTDAYLALARELGAEIAGQS